MRGRLFLLYLALSPWLGIGSHLIKESARLLQKEMGDVLHTFNAEPHSELCALGHTE